MNLKQEAPHGEAAVFLDFSPAGDRIAAAYRQSRKVVVRDWEDGTVAHEIAAPRDVSCVRFSPNGRRLAMVGFEGRVSLCDSDSGEILLTLLGTTRHVGGVGLTPRVIFDRTGQKIAANTWTGRITIWQVEPSHEP